MGMLLPNTDFASLDHEGGELGAPASRESAQFLVCKKRQRGASAAAVAQRRPGFPGRAAAAKAGQLPREDVLAAGRIQAAWRIGQAAGRLPAAGCSRWY